MPTKKAVVILGTTGVRDALNNTKDWKINLFYPILDAIINELQHRFDHKNLDLMKEFQCYIPDSKHFLDIHRMVLAIEHYILNWVNGM